MNADSLEAQLNRRNAVRLLPPICAAFLINYLDRFNISFAGLQLEASLGLSPVGFGWAGSCFAMGYLLFQVPANLGMLRVGARWWLGALAIAWGAVVCLTSLVRSPSELYAARFVLGAVEAGFVPAIVLYLSWWFPRRLRTQVVAAYGLGVPVAGVLGGPLAGGILTAFSQHGSAEGWRMLLLCEGVPAIAAGCWMLAALRNEPRDAAWLSAAEADLVARASALGGERPGPVSRAQFLATLCSPQVWKLCVIYFLQVAGTFGITFWLPQFLRQPGWESPWVIGWISAIPWLFGAAAIVVASRMADRRQSYVRMAIGCALAAALCFAAAGLVGDRWVSLALMTLAVGAMLALATVFWGLPPEVLAGERAAVGIPMVNAAGFAGALLSPVAIGWLAQSLAGLRGGILLSGVFLGACALMLFLWRESFRLEPEAGVKMRRPS